MNKNLALEDAFLWSKYPVAKLLQPTGGILSGLIRLSGNDTSTNFDLAATNLDNLTKIFPHLSGANGLDVSNDAIGGAGGDCDPELAWIRAVMEGGERYATMASDHSDFMVATANELGAGALDLDTIPRCSKRELADPKCTYVAPDKSKPIRWVKGYSLTDKCERLVPGVMSHLYLNPTKDEKFWQMISTGVAAHVTLEAALTGAICEVIERDAIAISWLAKLPLAKIELPPVVPATLGPNLNVLNQGMVKHHFFDATSDVGVPTVYAVQTLDGCERTAQYVNCSVEFDPAVACAKTIREAAPARIVFEDGYTPPDDIADFQSLYDGAAYLGRPEHRKEFDFLLNTPNRIELSQMKLDAPTDEKGRLNFLIKRLRQMGMDIIAVDLTTDELRELGVWVVRVVIPGLMPMSADYRARFLGTPRLYDYPKNAGFGSITEDDINRAPQPFA
jgi:ribosomal protein S12 methylthiotransferase accessory factor